MVTPYSLQIIPDDEELKEEEDQLVEDRSKGRRKVNRKTMAELTPEGQAARRVAQTAKRCRKRLRLTESKAAETKLETAKSEQLRRSKGTSLPVPQKIWVLPQRLGGRRSQNPVPENEPDSVYPGAFEVIKVQTEKEGQLSPVRPPPI